MDADELDGRIREDLRLELHGMPGIDPDRLVVDVKGGVVTLNGQVADVAARRSVEQLARRVLGVRVVANEIQVHPGVKDSHHEASLTRAVLEAFGRGHQGPS